MLDRLRTSEVQSFDALTGKFPGLFQGPGWVVVPAKGRPSCTLPAHLARLVPNSGQIGRKVHEIQPNLCPHKAYTLPECEIPCFGRPKRGTAAWRLAGQNAGQSGRALVKGGALTNRSKRSPGSLCTVPRVQPHRKSHVSVASAHVEGRQKRSSMGQPKRRADKTPNPEAGSPRQQLARVGRDDHRTSLRALPQSPGLSRMS